MPIANPQPTNRPPSDQSEIGNHKSAMLLRLCPNHHPYTVEDERARFNCPQCDTTGGCQFTTEASRQAYLAGERYDPWRAK